jgi:hypothetical protein
MGQKADELRAQARRLEERAGKITDQLIRSGLISLARSARELAGKVEQYEMEPIAPRSASGRLHRKAVIDAVNRAIRAYWEHTKSLPMPDRLTNLPR